MNNRLIFLRERDILLTTNTWTIVECIGTEDYDEVIKKIHILLDYLESQQNNTQVKSLNPYSEIFQLKTNLETTEKQVANIKLLLPSPRDKRGLINGLGTAFKFLFGTLDDDDYQTLNSKLDSLESSGDYNLYRIRYEKINFWNSESF